jgi:hypothetical protein
MIFMEVTLLQFLVLSGDQNRTLFWVYKSNQTIKIEGFSLQQGQENIGIR